MADANDLLDIANAAAFLSVSETSLRRWTNSGALPCLRVGRRRERRFRRGDLLAFMEQQGSHEPSYAWKVGSPTEKGSHHHPVTIVRGNHLCAMYASDAGRVALCANFLLEGLKEGSVCMLIAPPRVKRQVVQSLVDLRPAVSSDISKDRLVFCEYQKSARAQWKVVETHLENARVSGASSFRVVGDVTAMRHLVPPREITEYEAGFDERIVARFPVAVLCLYDARTFSGVELLNALRMHHDTLRYPLARAIA